jgi:RNA-binding protein
MTQQLSEKQKKYLRGLAHGREPIVLIGSAGLSPSVAKEFETALGAHELVKVKARVGDREQRDAVLTGLAEQSGSSLIQRIGNVGVFYRQHKDKPKIILPGE